MADSENAASESTQGNNDASNLASKLKDFDPYHYPSYSEYLFRMRRLRERQNRLKALGLGSSPVENDKERERRLVIEHQLYKVQRLENTDGFFHNPDENKLEPHEMREIRLREKRRLKKTLVEMIKEKAAQSSAHGLSNIATEHNKFVRVMWIIVMAISWSYLGYQVVNVVLLYSAFDITSTISLVYEAPTTFPAIDICNLNPYDGNVTRDLMLEIIASKNISMQSSPSAMIYTDDISDQIKASFENLSTTGQLDIYYSGFYISQMLIGCVFQGKQCSINDFYPYHDYDYGNCFRFNGLDESVTNQEYSFSPPASLRKSTKPGWKNGLRLELNIGDPISQIQYEFKRGMRVIIHNQTIVPFPSEEGVDVASGQQANIGITRTFIERLPYPYSDCIDELDEESAQRNGLIETMYGLKNRGILMKYQQIYCLKICYQQKIMKTCGCYDSSLTFLNVSGSYPGCFETDQVDCRQREEEIFYNSNEVSECYAKCPVECKLTIYTTDISVAAFPTVWYSNLYNASLNNFVNYSWVYIQEPSLSLLQDSQLVVNIFYDEMTYFRITEIPVITFEDLLANIGGNLGLFTGMSILSALEFVEMFILAGLLFYKYARAQYD